MESVAVSFTSAPSGGTSGPRIPSQSISAALLVSQLIFTDGFPAFSGRVRSLSTWPASISPRIIFSSLPARSASTFRSSIRSILRAAKGSSTSCFSPSRVTVSSASPPSLPYSFRTRYPFAAVSDSASRQVINAPSRFAANRMNSMRFIVSSDIYRARASLRTCR